MTSGVNGRAPLQCIGFNFGCRGSGSFCGGVAVRKIVKDVSGRCMSRIQDVTRRTASTTCTFCRHPRCSCPSRKTCLSCNHGSVCRRGCTK